MHTTVETSRLLFFAGFPQPSPEIGHIWYASSSGAEVVVVGKNLSKVVYREAERVWKIDLKKAGIFAPTATDIMRELPEWNLAYTTVFKWIVYWDAPGLADPVQFSDKNPAEAAALAWFFENEKR